MDRIGCDPSYIALPALAVVAGAIGTTRRIRLKNSWCEPAIVRAVVVGKSGTIKSPAMNIALEAIRQIQEDAFRDHVERQHNFEIDKLHHEKALRDWKRTGRETGE